MNTLHFTPNALSPAPGIIAETPLPQAPAPVVPVKESPLLQKAILVHLSLSQIGRTRLVREQLTKSGEELIAADTDRALVRVSKTLFSCKELKAIESLDTDIRAFIARKCLPSPLQKGVYLIPLGMVESVDARLRAFQIERAELVTAFVKVYPRLLVGARRLLRELFDKNDYPHRNAVAAHFGFNWQFIALGVPDALGEISTEIFERERQKAAAQWEAAQEEIQTLLRVRLKGMIEHLGERLKPGANGKSKIFRNTLVSNIDDFMQDFNALNITDDAELASVVGRVRDLLAGVDAQSLRSSQNVRDVVLSGAAQIEEQLTTLIVDKPKRLVTFDEE